MLCKFTAAQDPKQGVDTLRPYVPPTMRPAILRSFHDSMFSAHKGARDTYNQIASRYFWHQMERDVKTVRQYVRACGNRKEPTYLLVMVDPFSYRIWLEPIYSKHAEQVYDGFIRRILLEWGCPRAFLTGLRFW